MPYSVTFSPDAQADLALLEAYLAERFYPRNAERFVTRIANCCMALALAPHRGVRRDDLGAGIRMVGFERRVSIYFIVEDQEIKIEGIFHRGKTPGKLG